MLTWEYTKLYKIKSLLSWDLLSPRRWVHGPNWALHCDYCGSRMSVPLKESLLLIFLQNYWDSRAYSFRSLEWESWNFWQPLWPPCGKNSSSRWHDREVELRDGGRWIPNVFSAWICIYVWNHHTFRLLV